MAAVDAEAGAAEEAAEATWAITKVANTLKAAHDKQTENLIKMFMQMMEDMKAQPTQAEVHTLCSHP